MKISNNRFEESDTKTRKRHEVVLTTDSPNSISGEMELSACDIIHTVPSEKALADKAQREAEQAKSQEEAANEGVKEEDSSAQTEQAFAEEQAQDTEVAQGEMEAQDAIVSEETSSN